MNKITNIKVTNIDQIKCVWGLLCSLSSIDQQRNNISLFNVIEQFNIPPEFFLQKKKQDELILFPFLYETVVCWRRTLDIGISDEEIFADFKIKTVDPKGKVLQETLSPLKFSKGIKILRSRVTIQGLLLSEIGSYVYQIEIRLPNQSDFKKVLEIPFEVTESKNINH